MPVIKLLSSPCPGCSGGGGVSLDKQSVTDKPDHSTFFSARRHQLTNPATPMAFSSKLVQNEREK